MLRFCLKNSMKTPQPGLCDVETALMRVIENDAIDGELWLGRGDTAGIEGGGYMCKYMGGGRRRGGSTLRHGLGGRRGQRRA
jgi:hypothetical protein